MMATHIYKTWYLVLHMPEMYLEYEPGKGGLEWDLWFSRVSEFAVQGRLVCLQSAKC